MNDEYDDEYDDELEPNEPETTTTTSKKPKTAKKNEEGQAASNADEPSAKRAKSKCGTCKLSTCVMGKKCPLYKEYGDPVPPDATLVVPEGAAITVFDLELNEDGDDVFVNEVGAVTTSFSSGEWRNLPDEFKEVTNEELGWWGKQHCKGLDEERKTSEQGFTVVHHKFMNHIKKHKTEYLAAHGTLATDARVMVKAGRRCGIDVIAEWKAAGIKGIADFMRIIPTYKINELRHPGGKSVLSNGALYIKATKGVTMSANGLTEHRALDDSKSTLEWVTGLPEIKEVMFGLPRRPTAISIDALGAYYAQKRKHKEFIAGR